MHPCVKRRQPPFLPSPGGLLSSDTYRGELRLPGTVGVGPVRLTYRCARRREFVSELMAAWNADWSMTCCIITRSSSSLMLLMLLLLLPILMQMSEHPCTAS